MEMGARIRKNNFFETKKVNSLKIKYHKQYDDGSEFSISVGMEPIRVLS